MAEKRRVISIPPDAYEKLAALAMVDGKPTAALARAIIAEYLESRADDVEAALKFVANYRNSLKAFREKNSVAE